MLNTRRGDRVYEAKRFIVLNRFILTTEGAGDPELARASRLEQARGWWLDVAGRGAGRGAGRWVLNKREQRVRNRNKESLVLLIAKYQDVYQRGETTNW